MLLRTMVLPANLISASHTHWFVVNYSRCCVGLICDPLLLIIDHETYSIITHVVTPMWSLMVTSFNYLRADLYDRLQIKEGGNI